MASGNALSGSGKSARPAAPTHPGGQSQPSGQLRRLSDLGYLKLLPLDVRDSILRMLSPDHSCIRSPYGAHDCALSYGPLIRVCFSDHRYETELEPLLLRNRGESVGTGNH